MDIGKAFSFVFDDEQWVTVFVVGGLLTILLFVPLVNIVVFLAFMGYMLETARNVAMGSPNPLPRWDNFGEKLSLGFNAFLITLVWSLPALAVSMIFLCVPFLGAMGGDDAAAAAALGTLFCVVPIIIILAVVLQPLMLAAITRYLQTGSLGSAFQVGTIIAMVRADLGGWIVLWLLYALCGLVASAGSMVVIGMLFTYPYSQAVFGHILGQKLRQLAQPTTYGATYPAPPNPM
jgi:hypothetical protein